MREKPLIVICGPTATGKTSLGVKLCQEFEGEIVSVDSRQVYRGMDIGTGKLPLSKDVNKKIRNVKIEKGEGYWVIDGVKIHLYDIASPREKMSAVKFCTRAKKVVEDIWNRGKVPFLVGGTGFYLDVLLGRQELAPVPRNPELRAKLKKLSTPELWEKAREVNPERAKQIHPHDRHRLIRAIEIAKGKPQTANRKPPFVIEAEPLWVGLTGPRKELYRRIDERLERMVEAGLVEEVKNLVEKYGWKIPSLTAIGYRQLKPFLEGEKDLSSCLKRKKFDEHAYARRQLTYFKRNKDINWFDVTKKGFDREIKTLVKSYLDGQKD